MSLLEVTEEYFTHSMKSLQAEQSKQLTTSQLVSNRKIPSTYIVDNNKLRKLFTKGPKYREKKFVNWNHVEETILQAVKNCATSWSNKHNKNDQYLKAWISVVTEKVKQKISFLKNDDRSGE